MSDDGINQPSGGRLHLDTRRERVRCTCAEGHVFTATIYTAIDIDTNPGALDDLSDKGLQPVACPECETRWPLAEPLVLHAREGGRLALFVPEPLAHRELHLRAELMREVADADPDRVPSYAAEFQTLVGSRALKYWLFGPSARALATVPPPEPPRSAEPASPPKPSAEPRPSPAERVTRKTPIIHEAFADLMGPEARSSSLPPAPDMDGVDLEEDEPLLDEDWLDDDSLDAGYSRPATPLQASHRIPGERHAEPPPAVDQPDLRETAPGPGPNGAVDFAGLLSEEEDSGEYLVEDEELLEDADDLDLEDEEQVFGGALPETDLGGREEPGDARRDASDALAKMIQGEERGFEVIGDQVILHHRIAEEEADLFDPATSELWIQLRSVEGFPLAQLTLISDPLAADPRRLWWPLDLRSERHREVAHALRRSYRAEIRLVDEELNMQNGFEIAAERELNTAVVLKRASQMLEQAPGGEGSFAAAVEAAADLPQPRCDELPPPFDQQRLPEPTGLEDTAALLETLAQWTTGERRDDLVLVRSFPLDHLEAIVAELIGIALERGVALPEPLADRAVDSGHAADRGELAARLFAAFDRFVDRSGVDGEATAENWRRLLEECSRWGARPDVDAMDRAERSLERHGLLDESELAADLEALDHPEQIETGRLIEMLGRRKLRLRAMLALLDRDFAANREAITSAFGRLDATEIPAAVTALAARGDEVAGELALALASPAPQARQAAAVLLGSLALRRTLMPLLKALAAETTPIWPEFARAAAATGPAAQRSLERALADAKTDPERLAMVIAEMDKGRDQIRERLIALAESGTERAAEVLRLADRGRLGVGETSPTERYAALLHRAAKGETIAVEEVTPLIEPYEGAVKK